MPTERRSSRIDAVVLAGGRGSRLGGASKALSRLDGATLLDRSLATIGRAVPRGRVVVVGPDELDTAADAAGAELVREDPPFGGPAAGIAAGLDELTPWSDAADEVLVVAVDLVDPARAVSALLDCSPLPDGEDGAIVVDEDGRAQYLLGLYRVESLRRMIDEAGRVDGLPVRALTAGLVLRGIRVAPGAERDVDTLEDAQEFGILLGPRVSDAP